jgi:hypothetical protein
MHTNRKNTVPQPLRLRDILWPIGIVLAMIFAIIIFRIESRKYVERKWKEHIVKMTIIAIYNRFHELNKEYPMRVGTQVNERVGGWRWECRHYYGSMSDIDRGDSKHPILSGIGNRSKVFALASPNSPWLNRMTNMLEMPSRPFLVYSEEIPIPWAQPGDVVYDIPAECSSDIILDEFVERTGEPFLVGFTDLSLKWVTREELIGMLGRP